MRKVYVIHYHGEKYGLTVTVDGKSMPMDEFVQTHTPVQVTPLTLLDPATKAQAFIGLLIADEATDSAQSGTPTNRATWGR